MNAILNATATVDALPELMNEAARTFSQSAVLASLDDFTEVGGDGKDIAAPGALHAEQAVDALERGRRVLCQRPKDRTSIESHYAADDALRREVSIYDPGYVRSPHHLVINSVFNPTTENTLAV